MSDRHLVVRRLALGLTLALASAWSPVRSGVGQESRELPAPLSQAHAHNDYAHRRPLLDALAEGFCSIEADVFLVDGKLLVGHTRFELRPERTLRSLYLDPLQERLGKSGERVYPGGPPLTLLVDIKTDGAAAYRALDQLLAEYEPIITQVKDGEVTQRAINVIVSGDRPIELITNQTRRWAAIDGRLGDLQGDAPSHLIPLVSDNWRNHFRWRGEGEMPAAEKTRLREWVSKAHEQGRIVRFWATPENPAVWAELKQAGVDLIGTDDLQALARFLRDQDDSDQD